MKLRKITAILTAGILAASLAACGSSGSSGNAGQAQSGEESAGQTAEEAPAEESQTGEAPAETPAEPPAGENAAEEPAAPSGPPEGEAPEGSEAKPPQPETPAADTGASDAITFLIPASEQDFYASCWQTMTDYVSEKCPGISFNVQYSAEADTPSGAAENLKSKVADMTLLSPADLSAYVPGAGLIGACYLFDNMEQVDAVLNRSEVGQELADEAAQKAGIRLLGAAGSGSRQVILAIDRKVETREDLDGVLLRVPLGSSSVQLGEALGCMPNPMPLSQVETALGMGLIQGLEGTLPEITANSLEEAVKSVSMTNHSYGVFWVALREDLWQSFDEETRQAFQEGFQLAREQCTSAAAASDAELTAQLKEMGISVHDNLDLTKMKEEVLEFYWSSEEISSSWDKTMYDRIRALQTAEGTQTPAQ